MQISPVNLYNKISFGKYSVYYDKRPKEITVDDLLRKEGKWYNQDILDKDAAAIKRMSDFRMEKTPQNVGRTGDFDGYIKNAHEKVAFFNQFMK